MTFLECGPAGGTDERRARGTIFLRDEETTSGRGSAPTTLAICGGPVVGQALTLLLRGSGYEARSLPAAALLRESRAALRDVRLLVLAPTPELSTERREALLASLKETPEAAEMPVLELVTPSEERREEGTRGESWYVVPWPCRSEDLEWWIEAALLRHYGTRAETVENAAHARQRV